METASIGNAARRSAADFAACVRDGVLSRTKRAPAKKRGGAKAATPRQRPKREAVDSIRDRIVMPRRKFLLAATSAGLAVGGLARLAAPALAQGDAALHGQEMRYTEFLLRGSGERFRGVYFENGRYLDDALKEIDWALRDFHYDEVMMMDLRLINLISDIRAELGGRELIVTSGYRCQATNERLRRNGSGAVKRSFHLAGMAVDFYSPGLSVARLARITANREAGGVGRYDKRGFIHADVGKVRYWRG